MKLKEFKKVIKKGDHSTALLDEISNDINKLSTYISNTSAHLAKIDVKLDRARKDGLNVEKFERKLLDFRKTVVLRHIKMLLEKIDKNPQEALFDIDTITNEFNALKIELKESKLLDQESKVEYFFEIQRIYKTLQAKIIRLRIKFMILDIKDNSKTPIYNIERVTDEIMEAQAMGIDVRDLKDMLLD